MSSDLEWISAGRTFDVDDIVYYEAKGRRPLDDVLAEIDLVVTAPHASAAFPEEMAPFVDNELTRRLQFDFTDVSTSPVGQRWASIDPHVLYVENPHPRAVRDANRPRRGSARGVQPSAIRRRRSTGVVEHRPALGEGVDVGCTNAIDASVGLVRERHLPASGPLPDALGIELGSGHHEIYEVRRACRHHRNGRPRRRFRHVLNLRLRWDVGSATASPPLHQDHSSDQSGQPERQIDLHRVH